MYKKLLVVLFTFIFSNAGSAQCSPDSARPGFFTFYDEFKNPTLFSMDTVDRRTSGFIKNEKHFFDSLQVISFSSVLDIACKRGLVVRVARLSEDKREWLLVGREIKRRYQVIGDYFYKSQCRTLILDARNGKVKSDRKRWYRIPNRD
ncbi:MAG TPA: hypothetical protein VI112_05390 [Bacteroidia bacterium]|jgi:hypothetical protein